MKKQIISLFIPCVVMALLVLLLAFMAIKPDYKISGEYNQYGVIFSPYVNQQQSVKAIIKAGGLPLRVGNFDFIQIIASSDESFIENMYDNGAVFIFTPVIKGACYFENKSRFGVRY